MCGDRRHAHHRACRSPRRPHLSVRERRPLRGIDSAFGQRPEQREVSCRHVHRAGHLVHKVQAGEAHGLHQDEHRQAQHPQAHPGLRKTLPLAAGCVPLHALRRVRCRCQHHDGAQCCRVLPRSVPDGLAEGLQPRDLLQGHPVLPRGEPHAAQRPPQHHHHQGRPCPGRVPSEESGAPAVDSPLPQGSSAAQHRCGERGDERHLRRGRAVRRAEDEHRGLRQLRSDLVGSEA
mmetsp:Transcript_17866/g.38287  ORF Transcript_17866/g.38287 Transcript_17866/m.38287 type:complete len:233 (-) Transcript_17866:788-1486(-)